MRRRSTVKAYEGRTGGSDLSGRGKNAAWAVTLEVPCRTLSPPFYWLMLVVGWFAAGLRLLPCPCEWKRITERPETGEHAKTVDKFNKIS